VKGGGKEMKDKRKKELLLYNSQHDEAANRHFVIWVIWIPAS
jgi:hypothetical protein